MSDQNPRELFIQLIQARIKSEQYAPEILQYSGTLIQTLEQYVREVEETISRYEGQKQNIAIFGMRQRVAEVKYLLNQYDHVRLEKINNQIVFSE